MDQPDEEYLYRRSIIIRRGYKPLREYFCDLENPKTYYPIDELPILDDIFQSFLHEEDYTTCFEALKLLFKKIEFYDLQLANCKIAFNIGKLLDCFLAKFKDRLTDEDKNSLHEIIPMITSEDSLKKLPNLKDTEYVIAIIILKHYYPDAYRREENNILRRLENIDGVDDCVKSLIEYHYKYPTEELNELIYFQFRSFVLIKNTMMITKAFINDSMDKLSDKEKYSDDWIKIYANKMLSHVIVPLISYRQQNSDEIQIDDDLLLKWLLAFAEKSFGRIVREDKWESINDEDFDHALNFVRQHASPTDLLKFFQYLVRNKFEFQLSDPHSGYRRRM